MTIFLSFFAVFFVRSGYTLVTQKETWVKPPFDWAGAGGAFWSSHSKTVNYSYQNGLSDSDSTAVARDKIRGNSLRCLSIT